MTTSSIAEPPRSSGHLYLVLGLGLATLGVIGYAVQISMRHLTAPYRLALAGAGAAGAACRFRVDGPAGDAAAGVYGAGRGGAALPGVRDDTRRRHPLHAARSG